MGESVYHTYKGFEARFEWDEEGFYYGEVVRSGGQTFVDVITAQAETIEQAKNEMEISIDNYLDFSQKKAG